MSKKEILNEVINLLKEDEKNKKALIEKIEADMKSDSATVLSELLKIFTHLEIEPREAEKVWGDILKHRRDMSKTLGREVDLIVAMLDYFTSVNKQIKNPKVIEMKTFEKLAKSIMTDELTGLYNKRFFMETLYKEVQRAKRYMLDLSIIFLDIDDFKRCNELKGRSFGNQVLKNVARLIYAESREVDYPCRYGDDKFTIILPETRSSKAVVAAERLRREISKVNFLKEEDYYLTLSAGIASFGVDGNRPDELIENAEAALLKAKKQGKDRSYMFYREKRKFARIAADWDISYKVMDEKTKKAAKMKNIGGGGLMFEDEKPIPISSILDVTLSPPSERKKITARAKVVRLEIKEDGRFDIGIFFTRINPDDKNVILKYIE